jgi:hypothetical protein
MLGNVGEQRGPGAVDVCGHAMSFLRQVQTQHPTIKIVAPTLDPASSLEVGDQSADRALLEPEETTELALRERFIAGELGQRMRHRGTHSLAAWRLLDVKQPERPHEPHHLTL